MIHIGVSPADFWDMTLYEYRCYICKWRFDSARRWEHTRRIVHAVFRSQSASDIPVTDIMPLLTDPIPEPVKEPTAEEIAEMRRKVQARIDAISQLK